MSVSIRLRSDAHCPLPPTHTTLSFVVWPCRRRSNNFYFSNNQLVGTVPTALTAQYPLSGAWWASNCLTGVSSRYIGCDVVDRAALVDLFSVTSGLTWLSSTLWLTSASPCSWFGVTCDTVNGATVVVSLSLPSNGLQGTLPSSMSALTALT